MKRFTSFRSIFMTTALAAGTLALSSCEDKASRPKGTYAENAVLISNEGAFTASNASVSYYNRNNGTVENNIFSKENDRQVLGDVLQSIAVYNDRAYMVMNNSQKVVVANANTFKAEGEISGLEMPRYFAALDNQKAYVTEWVSFDNNGRVAVIDLNTLTVTKTIEVGVNPEQLIIAGGKVYVGHANGDFISVINTSSDAVETTIPVTHGPSYLVVDRDNNLWALSSGMKDWRVDKSQHTAGALAKINLSSNTVTNTLTFASNTASSGRLAINSSKDKLLYSYNGKIHQQDISTNTLNSTPLINRSSNSIGVDPASNYIYIGTAPNYSSDDWVVRYNTTGAVVDSFRVGIAPNGFVFR
ncbi:DUF5074 domain-containing protein [Pontibacter sp. 13R65]|uniref:DUF5074 domain-containing protein n=1 Tax=Pontibacter sp. 13R65 TaxID=3127458 RepID=UPI00301D746F